MIIKCPECSHEIESVDCPGCGESTPKESIFCINCGKSLTEQAAAAIEDDGEEFDPDDRVLCSDGNCTGIIIDGKCSECGKPPEPGA